MAPPFFWFPFNTQEWPGRQRALLATILCILGMIFREYGATKWVWIAFTSDLAIGSLTGGTGAPFGALAVLMGLPFERRFDPGTPRQAAMFVSMFFAIAGCFTLFYPDENYIGTFVILIMHAGASALAIGNICLVCVFYHYSTKFTGWPPKDTVEVCNDAIADVDAETTEAFKVVNPPTPERAVWKTTTGGVSVEFYKKGDDYERENFHPIKRIEMTYFFGPLSWAAYALHWKQIQLNHEALGDASLFPNVQGGWIDAMLIVSFVYLSVLTLIYLVRIALFPHRFLKDMQRTPIFLTMTAIPCSWLLIAAVLSYYDDFEDLAIAIWWISMPVQLFISVFGFGRFVSQPASVEAATPVFLLPSFGLLVLGVVSPTILYKEVETTTNYGDIGLAFFGAGFAMAVVFPVVLGRMMNYYVEFRTRPSICFFSAILTLIAMGMVNEEGTTNLFWFRMFLWGGFIFFFFVVAAGANMYFMEGKFDQMYWAFVFPTILLAMACNIYFTIEPTDGARAMSYGFTAAAGWGLFCASVNTITQLVNKKMFVPVKKFGPLTVNKTFHYYFRGIIPKLNKWSERVDMANESTVTTFIENLELFFIVFKEHAYYEDYALFPVFRAFFPGVSGGADEEHARDGPVISKMLDGIQTVRNSTEPSERQAAMRMLQGEIGDIGKDLIAHLDWEEENLNWIVRKFVNTDMQKEILVSIFRCIPIATWRKMLPHMMNFVQIPSRREKLIRCFLWAMPHYAPMLSVWMQDELSPFFFTRTIKSIPEITPRNHWDYKPYM